MTPNVDRQRKTLSRFSPLALAITSALVLGGAPAMAADADGEGASTGGIERITVTSQRREKPLQETPVAVSAFDDSAIEALGIEDLTDASAYAPNVVLKRTFGSSFNVAMNIRGNSTSEPSLAVDPKVGMYLDGVYLARSAGAVMDIVDLERMEIMRGPQGTLWGRNTTGGAVSMTSQKPLGEFAFKQQLTFGNFGRFKSITSVDTPMLGDLSAKFTYMKKQWDGWAENTYEFAQEKELGAEDIDAFRVALRYDATDNIVIDYAYDLSDGWGVASPMQAENVDPQVAAAPFGMFMRVSDLMVGNMNPYDFGNPFYQMAQTTAGGAGRPEKIALDSEGREDIKIQGHSLNIAWDLSPAVTLRSISSYRSYDSDRSGGTDTDGGAYFGMMGNPIPAFVSVGAKEQDQWSQEFQLVGAAMEGKLNYVAGLYYFSEEGSENNPWGITVPTGAVPASAQLGGMFGVPAGTPIPTLLLVDTWGNFYNIQSDAAAAYAQVNYQLTDQWGLTAGIRYSYDEKELTLTANDPLLQADMSSKEDWSEVTTTFIVDYMPTDDLNFYAKYAEGYAAGIFNPGTKDLGAFFSGMQTGDFSGVFAGTFSPADPERTDSYELGMKSMWADDRLQLNVAVFYNDNSNLQVTEFRDNVRLMLNSGSSTSRGVELEMVANPFANLFINGSYGYYKTENDSSEFDFEPNDSASLGVSYEWELGKLGYLNARVDYTYLSDQYFNFDLANPLMEEAYGLVNARVQLSEVKALNGNLKFAAWGRNLTDEEYRVYGAQFAVYQGYNWGDPRTYGIDVTYEF
ncbi:TonB-dependent receptor [Ferrimonas pelagia]|uniref:TonB-dependent receptor n=1 Tax=Ferrimonas pelagia TaxID=1177826 RepID=A0ABP9EMP0_9GAMM